MRSLNEYFTILFSSVLELRDSEALCDNSCNSSVWLKDPDNESNVLIYDLTLNTFHRSLLNFLQS